MTINVGNVTSSYVHDQINYTSFELPMEIILRLMIFAVLLCYFIFSERTILIGSQNNNNAVSNKTY